MSVATPLRLDTTACDRCGRCAPLCKKRALRIGPGYIFVDWDTCDACGNCALVCDRGAISLRDAAQAVTARPAPAAVAPAPKAPANRSKTAEPATKATPRPATPAASGAVEWALPEGGLVLVVAFALLVGAQSLLGTIPAARVWSGAALVGYDAVLAGLLWFLARKHGASMLAAFRLDVWPEWTSVLFSVAVALGCWLFSVTYRAAVLAIGLRPPATEGSDLTTLFGPGALGIVLTVAVVAIVGPALEEVLLRGVVMGSVQRRVGMWPAVIVSAVAFALLHASLWSLLPLTVLGVGLGWLAARSRSLWPAIVAHVLYNGVLVAAALYTAVR